MKLQNASHEGILSLVFDDGLCSNNTYGPVSSLVHEGTDGDVDSVYSTLVH